VAERRQRAPWWVWPLLVVILIAPPVGWLLAHRLSSPTKPRWTEADLPTPPPDADNGWITLWRRSSPFHRPDLEALQNALDGSIERPERVDGVRADAVLLIAEANAQRIAIDDAEAAFSRRRFADACPIAVAADCGELSVLGAQKLVSLRVFALAVAADFPRAFEIAGTMTRALVDYVGSARRFLSAAAGSVALLGAFATVEDLIALARRSNVDAESWSASRSALEAAMGELDAHPPDPARAVIGEYVLARSALASLGSSSPDTSPWLVDQRATTALVDEQYAALHAYASGTTSTPPTIRDPVEEPLWWIYNHDGKILVSLLSVTTASAVARTVDYRDQVIARGRALREELGRIGTP